MTRVVPDGRWARWIALLGLACSAGGPNGPGIPPPPPPPSTPLLTHVRALVAGGSAKKIYVVDFSHPVPIREVWFGREVQGMALSPDNTVLYVALSWPQAAVIGVDVAPLLTSLDPPVERFHVELPVEELTGLAILPDGSALLALGTDFKLYLVDTQDGTVEALPFGEIYGGFRLSDIGVSPDGRLALVAGDSLRIIDVPGRGVIATLDVGRTYGVAFSEDGRVAYLADTDQGTLKVDLEAAAVVARFESEFILSPWQGSSSQPAVQLDRTGSVVMRTVQVSDRLALHDANTGALLGSMPLPSHPSDMELERAGKQVVILSTAFTSAGFVQVVDLESLAVEASVWVDPYAVRLLLYYP